MKHITFNITPFLSWQVLESLEFNSEGLSLATVCNNERNSFSGTERKQMERVIGKESEFWIQETNFIYLHENVN